MTINLKRKRLDSQSSSSDLLVGEGCAYIKKRSRSLGLPNADEIAAFAEQVELNKQSFSDDEVDCSADSDDSEDDEFEFGDDYTADSDVYADDSDQEFSTKTRTLKTSSSTTTKNSTGGSWKRKDDDLLMKAVRNYDNQNHNSKKSNRDWKVISSQVPGKSEAQCANRWQKVLNPTLIKGPWTAEEDEQLRVLVNEHGARQWTKIASLMKGRVGKQCNERWHNHLAPELRKGPFTPDEDRILIQKQAEVGNKWAIIATYLPGRAQNTIKNRWNATLKRRRPSLTKSQSGSTASSLAASTPSSSSAPFTLETSPKRTRASSSTTTEPKFQSPAVPLSASFPNPRPRKYSLDSSSVASAAAAAAIYKVEHSTASHLTPEAMDLAASLRRNTTKTLTLKQTANDVAASIANTMGNTGAPIPDAGCLMVPIDPNVMQSITTEWPGFSYQAPIPTYPFMPEDFDYDLDATMANIPDSLFDFNASSTGDIPGISSPLSLFESYDELESHFLFLNNARDLEELTNQQQSSVSQSAPSQIRC